MTTEPTIVQAIYSFKATNNDELCFKKGDKITVTQKEEGGWWEGTLGEKTGWFPNNYVKDCKDAVINTAIITQQQQYRAIVLQDLIESEKAQVTELQGLVNNFLNPLEKSGILSFDEYKQLTGNLTEILDTHQQLLTLLEEEKNKSSNDQKVGKLFLTWAPKIKMVHQGYCSLHPKAVCILDKFKEELTKFMESCGAATPGVLVLTTGLSKPFRRLEKYSGMLQELERHVEESHPDRGDIQRSVAIYKDIAATCSATRRQKELELQVLTGPIKGWEGQTLSTLGDIIYMGSVAVGLQRQDKYFVLFPNNLVILSVSPRLSAFIYEGKLPLSGLSVTKLEDNDQYKNAFELAGPMIEKRVAVCQSKEEATHWVDLLKRYMPTRSVINNTKIVPSKAEFVPQPPPHMGNFTMNSNNSIRQGISSTRNKVQSSQGNVNNNNNNNNRTWSASCLRPAPPLPPCLALGCNSNGLPIRPNRKPISYIEDGCILEVIEVYRSSVLNRNAVNSVDVSSEQLNNRLYEKLQILESKLDEMEFNVTKLTTQFNEERSNRIHLQNILKTDIHSRYNHGDFNKIDWPSMTISMDYHKNLI